MTVPVNIFLHSKCTPSCLIFLVILEFPKNRYSEAAPWRDASETWKVKEIGEVLCNLKILRNLSGSDLGVGKRMWRSANLIKFLWNLKMRLALLHILFAYHFKLLDPTLLFELSTSPPRCLYPWIWPRIIRQSLIFLVCRTFLLASRKLLLRFREKVSWIFLQI